MFINEEVKGPFAVDQLIRQRGFSRETRVCRETENGETGDWVSPADIPELAKVFRAVDELNTPDLPPAPPPKPAQRRSAAPSPSVVVAPSKKERNGARFSVIILMTIFLGAAAAGYVLWKNKTTEQQEKSGVIRLVEQTSFPTASAYRNLRQYFDIKQIHPRWDFERQTAGLYHVTLSWFEAPGSTSQVLAFEANLPVQAVRGLNSLAQRWMDVGPDARSRKSAAASPKAPPKPSPEALFKAAWSVRQAAFQNRDYSTIWKQFSQRKQSEMIQAGMSESGFVKLQTLRHPTDSSIVQNVLKTRRDRATERLVLIKETQMDHGDIFIKQKWVFEDDEWRLDDEEKHAAAQKLPVHSLPGISQ